MAKLLLSMNGQTLTVKKTIDQIIEKSHQYLEYEFENFTSDWYGVVKDVIFTHGKTSLKAVNATVPDEVIQAPGFVVSVVGYVGEGDEKRLIITTNSVPVQVHPAGAMEGNLPSSSNPDADWLEEVKSYSQEFQKWLEFGMGKNIQYKIPFTEYNTAPSSETGTTIIKDVRPRFVENNSGQIVEDTSSSIKFSPIMKCPRYLGFRIDGDAKLCIYIGTMNGDKFVFNKDYYFNTAGEEKVVNYLGEAYSTFLETRNDEYFYYRVIKNSGNVTIYGADEFPKSEIDGIATTNQFAKGTTEDSGSGDELEVVSLPISTQDKKYYGAVLPTGCFYAILNKLKPNDDKNAPTSAVPGGEPARPSFNLSYQIDGTGEVQIFKGASFGYIPDNAGAVLLRFPTTYALDDFEIYVDKKVKTNAGSGRRRRAKDIGKQITEDFYFESQKDIFWNDSVRPMIEGRRFYGVPYSSRWANSHYVGFEVSPTTAFNALNNKYSVAYEGGFTRRRKGNTIGKWEEIPANEATGKERSTEDVSSHSEILGDLNDPKDGGGPGYGLVCSAFTCLINGNPYPQTNRGYTFDDNFVIENTIDMNSGEVLVNKGLTHCVFVDETYDNGFSLYEAVDPCVAKTIHTALEKNALYAKSKVRTNYLDNYIYSVINKDISGYDKKLMVESNPDSEDKLALLKNFDVTSFEIPRGKVRPWRGHMSVYGPWDKETELTRTYQGSGIGLTFDTLVSKFTLKLPSGKVIEFNKKDAGGGYYEYTYTYNSMSYSILVRNSRYLKIAELVTENGEYEVNDGSITEKFRYYGHEEVQLTFDKDAKAVFKNPDGSIAEDVEYVYVDVIGYGAGFDDTNYAKFDFNDIDEDTVNLGGMVIAKGKRYPDLALYPKRIHGIYAAIVSDISTDERTNIESWGKYSCMTSTTIKSDYRGDETDISGRISRAEDNISKNEEAIATNTSNITTNTSNIATNTSNIATNTSDIATNTSNIATNTSDIQNIKQQIADVDKILFVEVKDNILYIKYLKDTKEVKE